ncbi:glycoside hydrolase family 127 protein [Arthrobacter sp. ISL-30]|uniref:glycoside hydrolase family 127 protein n=1 Tax=Arthrobacter sp. ISL-30 TaxID=2819109 RepID=UPI001BE8A7D5|nr:glycoside hydrolase family 127 protein [Arthrobacter sp. ISL-30]MBT2514172.1 glycoside hydrolase family 127 protein [Arthrobacter sp. ISL-30]
MTLPSTSATTPVSEAPSSFPLSRTRLLDGDFKKAQDTAIRYVLTLDPDRLCAPFRREAGLTTATAAYGGWESDGLDGHIAGHYLSACAQLHAATGDSRLLARLEHVLGILEQCQDAAGDGYLGGVPGGRKLGLELAAGTVDADLFTLNGRWVPLYNLHKTFAGLLDAYIHADSHKALAMVTRLADWWLRVSASLSDDSFEDMLHTEFGGMNDAFAMLADITGKGHYLQEARRFTHRSILEPLAAGSDRLDGLHANTQIPKVVGYERLARSTGDPESRKASDFFWNTVTRHRSVSIGGNSVREHFHPASDFAPMILDAQGPETCNTYNMLKLARMRFERSGDPAAVDFYERATYNHILSSQHPERGGFVYFTSMRPAHYRVYSTVHESMWCCVGSSLENHARYGEFIYSRRDDDLLVNLYIASELDWSERGLTVRLETDFPRSDVATLHVTAESPTAATVRLRRPAWAAEMSVDVDGSPADAGAPFSAATDAGTVDGGYVPVHRVWEGTSTITVRLSPELRAELLPDSSPWVSFLYGPVVLAARVGATGVEGFEANDTRMGHVASGPLLPLSETPIVAAVNPLDSISLSSRASLTADLAAVDAEGRPRTIQLEPFFGIHDERYTVYWPVGDHESRAAELRRLDREAAAQGEVVDSVVAGEQQPEADHSFNGESTRAGGQDGIHWRSATGWFSYTLSDVRKQASLLRVRFRAVEGRAHGLRLNGVVLLEAVNSWREGDQDVSDFAIPEEARNAGDDGRLVFAVHALPGALSGDLLAVELLGTERP